MKIKEHFIEVTLTILLVVCGITVLGYFVRPTDTDEAYSQVQTFHSLPENSVDVIIYGSSHAFRGVDPMVMYEKYGIGAYNYAWHWQRINTTRMFFEDSLDSQKPKIALIEGYRTGEVLKDTDITAEIYYSRYIPNKDAVKKYLDMCFQGKMERYLSYYVPFYAFHANWSNATLKSFQRLSVDSQLRETMGFFSIDEVKAAYLYDPVTFKQKELDEDAVEVLDDILETCEEKDIEVIFFTVPYEGEYNYGDAMEQYAEENDCAYIDLFEKAEEIGIDGKKDFSDFGHLNKYGAAKVADYLGAYIKENYDIEDMRLVEDNLWEKES